MPEEKISPYVTELFAIEQVGPRRWGKHWIKGLTDDERLRLEMHGLLGESADVSDLLRQQESEKDAPVAHRAERQALTAARLQQALMLKQRQAVHVWLDGWVERKYPGRINRAQLEAALAAALPQAEAPPDREPGCTPLREALRAPRKTTAGRRPVLMDRTIALLRHRYPNGKPDDVTYDMIRADLEKAAPGLEPSDKIIREAFRVLHRQK